MLPLLVPPPWILSVPVVTSTIPLLVKVTLIREIPVPPVLVNLPALRKAALPIMAGLPTSVKVAPYWLSNTPPLRIPRLVPLSVAVPWLTSVCVVNATSDEEPPVIASTPPTGTVVVPAPVSVAPDIQVKFVTVSVPLTVRVPLWSFSSGAVIVAPAPMVVLAHTYQGPVRP